MNIIESVRIRTIDSARTEIVFIVNSKDANDKKARRIAYLRKYYQDHPDKFKKKKIIVRERVQDRIDKTFRDEDDRLSKIKYAYCQNASCPKPAKKYVAGSGVKLDYDGLDLYFCSGRCEEAYLAQAIKIL